MALNDTLLVLDPLANHSPAANFATLDMRGEFLVLDFDATANEQAQFHAIVPSHYKGAKLQLAVTWTPTTATTGNAKLRVELTRIEPSTNLDSLPPADATVDVTVAAPATSGVLVRSEFASATVSDLAAGDLLRVQLSRLATDAADTMTGDLELAAIEVREVA
jgi:hypothetical protein